MKTRRKITMQKIMHYVHVCNGKEYQKWALLNKNQHHNILNALLNEDLVGLPFNQNNKFQKLLFWRNHHTLKPAQVILKVYLHSAWLAFLQHGPFMTLYNLYIIWLFQIKFLKTEFLLMWIKEEWKS